MLLLNNSICFIDFFFSPFNTLYTVVAPANDVCRGYRCFCQDIKAAIPTHIYIRPILFPKQRNRMFTRAKSDTEQFVHRN